MRKLLLGGVLGGLMAVVSMPTQAQEFDPALMKLIQPAMRMMQRNPVMLLANPGVQAELKMDDEQKKLVTEKSREMMTGGKERFSAMFEKLKDLKDVPEDKREAKLVEILKPDMDKAAEEAAKLLKPEQMKRLKQIGVQTAGISAYTDADTAKELKLTDEQKSKITKTADELQKDIAELMRSSGGGDKGGFGFGRVSPETREKMQNLTKEATEKIQGMLTSEQKTKWKDMVGEPFEMKFNFRPMRKKDD